MMPSKKTRLGLLLTILLASVGVLYHHLPRNEAEVSVGINSPAPSKHCNGKSETECAELYGCIFRTSCLYVHNTANFDQVKQHIQAGTEWSDSLWFANIVSAEKAASWYQRSIIFTGIQGFSCAEGGSGGQSRDWAGLWGVFKVWAETAATKTLAAFVEGTAIGSSSGGGWFVSDLLFSSDVQATFAEGQTVENLKAAAVGRQQLIHDAIWKIGDDTIDSPTGTGFWDLFGATEGLAMAERYKKEAGLEWHQIENIFQSFMYNAHSDYPGANPTPIDAHWYQSTVMPVDLCPYRDENAATAASNVDKNIYLGGLNHGDWTSRAIPVLIKVTSPASVTAFVPALKPGTTNDLVQTAGTPLKLGTSSSDPDAKTVTYEQIKAAIEAWPKTSSGEINTRILSAPTSDAPGVAPLGNIATRGVLNALMDVGSLVVKTPKIGSADVGLCMGDSGISDPAGVAGAIKGMQERLTSQQTAIQKVVIFINGGKKEWSVYIADNPSHSQDIWAKPYPKIFASKHQMGPTIKLSNEVKLTTILVETIENKEWGIKAGYFYEIIAFDSDFTMPIMPGRDADLTVTFANNMESIANAIVGFNRAQVDLKVGISMLRENWIEIILLASIITSAVLLCMATADNKQLQYSLLDENLEEV